jgi:hypothetical protein
MSDILGNIVAGVQKPKTSHDESDERPFVIETIAQPRAILNCTTNEVMSQLKNNTNETAPSQKKTDFIHLTRATTRKIDTICIRYVVTTSEGRADCAFSERIVTPDFYLSHLDNSQGDKVTIRRPTKIFLIVRLRQ